MDPATALALGSAAAGFGSGFFAPEGEDIQGFSGQGVTNNPFTGEAIRRYLDPRATLTEGLGQTRALYDVGAQRAMQPVTYGNTLPTSFVQQPATFSGGGLPFDIGVTAFDPLNPFYEPTPPPGGFSPEASAFLEGLRGGGQPAGPGGSGFGGTSGGHFGLDDSQEFEPGDERDALTDAASFDLTDPNFGGINWNQYAGDPRPPKLLPADPVGPDTPVVDDKFSGEPDEGDFSERPDIEWSLGGPPNITDEFLADDPRDLPPKGKVDTDWDWSFGPMGITSGGPPQQPAGNDFITTLKMLGAPVDQILEPVNKPRKS